MPIESILAALAPLTVEELEHLAGAIRDALSQHSEIAAMRSAVALVDAQADFLEKKVTP